MSKERVITHKLFNSIIYSSKENFCSIQEQVDHVRKSLKNASEPVLSEDLRHYNALLASDEEFEIFCDSIDVDLEGFLYSGENATLDDAHFINNEVYGKNSFFRHINSLIDEYHEHTFFELCYVWKGGINQSVNDMPFDIQEGGFSITPPGLLHSVTAKSKDSIIFNTVISKEAFRNVLFEALASDHSLSRYLRKALSGEEIKRPYIFHFNPEDEQSLACMRSLKNIFKHAVFEYFQGSGNALIISGFLNQIFGMIMSADDRLHSGDDYFIDILDYININFRDVSLRALSEAFGYNETYLSRLIKNMTGKTFSELVRYVRVSYAENLLLRDEIPVREIGEMAGYYDYAGFVRAFEKEKGIKPAEYRKAYLNGLA